MSTATQEMLRVVPVTLKRAGEEFIDAHHLGEPAGMTLRP